MKVGGVLSSIVTGILQLLVQPFASVTVRLTVKVPQVEPEITFIEFVVDDPVPLPVIDH